MLDIYAKLVSTLSWKSICLIPRPHYFAAVNSFWVKWLSAVRLGYVTGMQTVKAWGKGLHELGEKCMVRQIDNVFKNIMKES